MKCNKWKQVSVWLNSQQPPQSHIALWNVKTFLYNDVTVIFSYLKLRTAVKSSIYPSLKKIRILFQPRKLPVTCLHQIKTRLLYSSNTSRWTWLCLGTSQRFFSRDKTKKTQKLERTHTEDTCLIDQPLHILSSNASAISEWFNLY